MVGISARVGDRYLMGAPEAFDFQAIDFLRAGPAFRTAEHHHWAFWTIAGGASVAGGFLHGADALQCSLERVGHQPMHQVSLAAFDNQGYVAVADEETADLIVAH